MVLEAAQRNGPSLSGLGSIAGAALCRACDPSICPKLYPDSICCLFGSRPWPVWYRPEDCTPICGFMSGTGQRNLPERSKIARRIASRCLGVDIMGRAIGAVIVALVAVVMVDHHFNF